MKKMKRKITWDDNGDVLGMPLQMIIMVVIAGISLTIIIAWVLSIQGSTFFDNSIRIEMNGVEIVDLESTDVGSTIDITFYDTDGNKVEGASVSIEGLDVFEHGTTDSDGVVSLTLNGLELPPSSNSGHIYISAEKTGFDNRFEGEIMVYRA